MPDDVPELTDEDDDLLFEILSSEAVQNMFGLEKVEALLAKLYGGDEAEDDYQGADDV